MKMKGAEWNKFYNDEKIWIDGVWHDDLVVTVNGEELSEYDNIDPSSIVEISSGVIYFDENCSKSQSFTSFIKYWRKLQEFTPIVVDIPNEHFQTVIEYLKTNGCKVVK